MNDAVIHDEVPAGRRLRVAYLVDYVVGGGGERVAVDLALHMAKRHEVMLISSRLDAQAAAHPRFRATIEELRDGGVRFVPGGRTSTFRVWQWLPVVRRMREHRVDVLHSHLFGSNVWAPVLGRFARRPVVVAHEHSPFVRTRKLEIFLNRWHVSRRADAVIAVSEWSKAVLVAHERLESARVHVIRNGIVPSTVDPVVTPCARRELRELIGVPPSAKVVLQVAMLRPEKGHEISIAALAQTVKMSPDVHLVIAGGGTPQNPHGRLRELENLANELEVSSHVHFVGRRDDTRRLMAGADVGLLTSHREALPLAILEYMDSRLPIVSSDVGAIGEAVRSGIDGLLVPPGDVAATAEAVAGALSGARGAVARAESAYERRREEFSVDRMVRKVDGLYTELLRIRQNVDVPKVRRRGADA